jgi:DNA-binding SARP family transcriptional activator/ABC-type oligopeptide transport system substrate-binding subunit/streptogramin lyase
MEFRLLGPIEALRDGRSVALGGAKPRALLALLLLHASEVVSRDRLIDALWGDRPPGTAEHSLDVQVSRLRKSFEPDEVLLTRSGGYVLQVEADQVDAQRFERLLEEGRGANAAGEPAEALEVIREALGLWRGPALADLAYEEFARTEVERLEELRLVATEERFDAELALGLHSKLVPELEALSTKHPHRERLRAQLMLALYRSGRQAEALRVYSDTRKSLVDELGIEPGQPLRELEQAILRQDPSLDLSKPLLVRRRRRAFVSVLAVGIAGVVAAAVVLVTQGGAESAQAAESESDVFLTSASGKIVERAAVRDTTGVRFGAGSLWSVSSEGELTRVDPTTGKVLATIGLGITRPGGIAFGEGSVWVTDAYSPTLMRIDPAVNDVVDRFALPMNRVVTNLTGGVAVGAGSVWVGHGQFNPGAWVERLDPRTGRVQHRFPIEGGDADSVAFGDGALWVGSEAASELRKIDPRTNKLVFSLPLQQQVCCVAAGGGFVWAASNPEAVVWKVTSDGSRLPTIRLPSAIKNLTYADRALWAATGEGGSVIRIDPTTDRTQTFEVGHNVTDVDARDGLVVAGVQPNAQDVTAGLKGDVVRIGLKSPRLFEIGGPTFPSTDPALYEPWDKNMLQFDHATCAKLYDYPDVEGRAGRTVEPEVAADFPTVSDGGHTDTIKIRDGFRFSPPSNEPVTAASFRDAIERDISPTFAPDYLDPRWKIIVGAEAYNSGTAAHVSGISADGDTLVIRLTRPEPDLPRALALNVFCAVPAGTPITPHGLKTPISSAGPFYLAALTDSTAVLKRNPNYGGSRPQHLDAIVFRFGVAAKDAVAAIANGALDYLFENDPALAPDTEAARAAGERYRLIPDSTGSNHFLAFNWGRPLFSSIRMRRAVQYALDRRVLAEADPNRSSVPATGLLSPKTPGFTDAPLYPLRGDLRVARLLAGNRNVYAVLATFNDSYNAAFNQAVRNELAAIGIRVTVLPLTNEDFSNGGAGVASKRARSDLIWGGLNAETSDPVSYLQGAFLPAADRAALDRISKLSSPDRERKAIALARRIENESLFAVYDNAAIPELVSRRLGCIVHQPEYPGVDLAALCLRDGHG